MIEECRQGEREREEMGAEGGEKAELSHYLKLCQSNGLSEQLRAAIHQVREGGERRSSNKLVAPTSPATTP